MAKGKVRERARWLCHLRGTSWQSQTLGGCMDFCSAFILGALRPPCPTEVLCKGSCLPPAPLSHSFPIKLGAIKCLGGVWDLFMTRNRESVNRVCCG